MDPVDSKKKKMPLHEILMTTYKDNMLTDDPNHVKVAGVALVKEFSTPNSKVEQVGNTVFGSHRGVGENKGTIVGRVFNRDTADNFTSNYVKYLKGLGKQGVTLYVVDFKDKAAVAPIVKVAEKLRALKIPINAVDAGGKLRFMVKVA